METKNARIYGSNGQEVRLRGVNWFGFNNGGQAPNGLWTGNPLASDFATVVARMRCLGFNAVRLPFSFKDLDPAKGTANDCTFDTGKLPTPSEIAEGCGLAGNSQAVGRASLPYKPARQGTRCNGYLPSKSVWDRFVYVVQFFARNGFYVLIDNHLREDNTALTDRKGWLGAYQKLVAQLCADGSTKARLMVDVLNEPDQMGLRWEPGANSLTDLHLAAMDAINQVAPVLFLLEGAGQGGLNANWGDGFCCDGEKIKKLGLSDPRPFFKALAQRPYRNRVVLSPHIYGPAVTTNCHDSAGPGLVQRLTASFGSKMMHPQDGQLYPIAVGEMGSKFSDDADLATLKTLAAYLCNTGEGADHAHHSITSWFYWCWNANSGDTGGLVADDWVTLQKVKLGWLKALGL